MDHTFLTRPNNQRSTFEKKYIERFGSAGEKRVGLPGLSPQLVDKQQEMEKTNNQLEDARNKFETWKTNFQRKKKEIEEKQQDLSEQKRQLDAFSQQQMASLEKAKKREQEEIDQAKAIEKELKKLTEEEERLRNHNDKLKKEIEELQPCADYLQSVVESCQSFDNIDAILHRYQSLSNIQKEYQAKYKELMSKYGTDEAEMAKTLEVQKSHLIQATMEYNEGITRVSQNKKLNEYRRTKLIKDVQRIEDKNVELAAIRTSIRTIYNRALERSATAADERQKQNTDVNEESMLQYVENKFNDLKEIIEDKKVVYIDQSANDSQIKSSVGVNQRRSVISLSS